MAKIKRVTAVVDAEGNPACEVQEFDTETQDGALVKIDVRMQELLMLCADYENTYGGLPCLSAYTRFDTGRQVAVSLDAK